MKKYLFGFIILSLILAGPIYSQATSGDDNATNTENTEETEENKSLVPDSVPMDLQIKEGQRYVFPETYRGGDPDSTLVHVLEDVEYERHEHALIYVGDAEALAKGAEFEDDPNIVWNTKKKNGDGDYEDAKGKGPDDDGTGDNNNNKATCTEKMDEPGDYQICNSGARNVSEPTEEDEDVGIGGTDEEMASASKKDDDDGEGEGDDKDEDKDTKTVTSSQTLGVIVHDCTAPDVWIAFKEGAGKANIDMYAQGNILENQMFDKMKETKGEPFSDNASDYEEVSYLFIDEGSIENKERDKEPWNKTARVTTAGSMFNEKGRCEIETNTINSLLIDEETQLRLVRVDDSDENKISGIYVRKNVPFVFAAASVDNGTERIQSTKNSVKKGEKEIECRIENAGDNSVVQKENGAYMFRVANYPRASFGDQPDYVFVAASEDAEGNITEVRLPIYIVDTNAAFETTK